MATALITGCSKGLGRATALRLAADGWDVWATMRNPDQDGPKLMDRATAAGVKLTVQQLNVTVEAAVIETFQRAGDVELLINNAAAQSLGWSVEESSLDDWRLVVDTNSARHHPLHAGGTARERQRRSGSIINVTTAAVPVAFPGTGAYTASKAAIEQVSEVAAIEVRPYGVRSSSSNQG